MKIRVESVSELAHLMPHGTDETELDLPAGATPNDALDALAIPTTDGYMLIVNDAIVPKAARDSHSMAAGDVLQILLPLKGG